MGNVQNNPSYKVSDTHLSVRAATARAREELLVLVALTIWTDDSVLIEKTRPCPLYPCIIVLVHTHWSYFSFVLYFDISEGSPNLLIV